jgi:DNA-binding FadR family transcriptional regulator
MNLSRSMSLMHPAARVKNVQAEHRTIFEAIRRREPQCAHEAMRRHVESARFRMFEGEKNETLRKSDKRGNLSDH